MVAQQVLFYFRRRKRARASHGCSACSSRSCSTARWPSRTCSTRRSRVRDFSGCKTIFGGFQRNFVNVFFAFILGSNQIDHLLNGSVGDFIGISLGDICTTKMHTGCLEAKFDWLVKQRSCPTSCSISFLLKTVLRQTWLEWIS